MAKAKQAPSILACVGMVGGVLLLSFAGVLVVMAPTMTPASLVTELAEQSTAIVAERTQHFLQASPRHLQGSSLRASTATATTTTVTVTTRTYTTHLSSLDSMDQNSLSGSSSESSKSSESQFMLAMPLEEEKAYFGLVLPWNTAGIVEFFFAFCFAICYHQCAVKTILAEFGTLEDLEEDGSEDDLNGGKSGNLKSIHSHKGRKDFKNGKFGCLSDIWVTVHGCICPLPRMGHTNAVAGVCGYWETIICFGCCSVVTCGLGPFCLVPYWRKRVKEAMGIDYFGLSDCCFSTFCILCNVCQQASAVDRKMGYVVSGCCEVTSTGF